jgi:hypothetical protein
VKSKSEKFRELLEEEKRLRNQLMDSETARHRMLKKAFNGLGLKMGLFSELVNDRSNIAFLSESSWSVIYCRYTGVDIETCEISIDDLFDAEVKQ